MERLLRIMALAVNCALILLTSGSIAAAEDTVECGPRDQKVKIHLDGKQRPLPKPGPGKALIYFIELSGTTRGVYQTEVAVNGKWVGATRGDSYFFLEADPGLLKVCSTERAMNPKFFYLTAEAGKTYYVSSKAAFGPNNAQVTEDRAMKALARSRYRYSTSRIEGR